MRLIRSTILRAMAAAVCGLAFSLAIAAQSTDPNFPTAVTTNEINGTIKARDIGDSRLTSYFYTFDGGQGDVFVNVVTRNFSGDIDVFAAEGLRPLTKIVIYADASVDETGRLIYLRKGERLILRVEGRSPNDDAATFRIKFAGSFVALAAQKAEGAPAITQPEIDGGAGIRVNSVGTIVAVIPKPQSPAKAKVLAKENPPAAEDKTQPEKVTKSAPISTISRTTVNGLPTKPTGEKTAPVRTPVAKKPAAGTKKDAPPVTGPTGTKEESEPKTVFKRPSKSKSDAVAKPPTEKGNPAATPEEKKVDPLASILLVVQLKEGKTIERPMSEVLKFSVDNGVLTVIAKDGSIVKYSILDVAKVTIE